MLGIGVGCRSAPRGSSAAEPACPPGDAGLQPRAYFADLKAVVAPPLGWTVGKREDATAEGHRVWVSPTGKTAYGVIHFSLPLPVGYEPVLWVFIREMRRSEGEAILISRQWDSNHNLLRFVARGGLYTVRTSLFVRGFSGWAVYAGTLTRDPVVPEELTLAERARELTLVGRAATPSRGK
jgi:hypothetical protein